MSRNESSNLDSSTLDWLSAVAQSAKQLHKKSLDTYELWREFLKRSKKYEKVCTWFENIRTPANTEKSNLFLIGEIAFDLFVDSYLTLKAFNPPVTLENYFSYRLKEVKEHGKLELRGADAFFATAYELGFPFEDELLMNYFVFGDVFRESEPYRTFRLVLITQTLNLNIVCETHETLNLLFRFAEEKAKKVLGREPTVREFQSALKLALENDHRLHITIANPYQNKDEIQKRISEVIDNRRKNKTERSSSSLQQSPLFKPGRFELPGGNIRTDELTRYLTVYDLARTGKKTKEIANEVYKGHDSAGYVVARMILRDRQKAEKIIANVEKGFFPGKY